MIRNFKIPENIDKLIERQSKVTSVLDGNNSFVSNFFTEDSRRSLRKRGKVYQKIKYYDSKK